MALIQLNRTKTGAVPTSLADGELYIDQLNGLIYYTDATGVVRKISNVDHAALADKATDADTVDGKHVGVAANQLIALDKDAKIPSSADKVIIATTDPVATQGDQNWLWLKV